MWQVAGNSSASGPEGILLLGSRLIGHCGCKGADGAQEVPSRLLITWVLSASLKIPVSQSGSSPTVDSQVPGELWGCHADTAVL